MEPITFQKTYTKKVIQYDGTNLEDIKRMCGNELILADKKDRDLDADTIPCYINRRGTLNFLNKGEYVLLDSKLNEVDICTEIGLNQLIAGGWKQSNED